MRFYKVVINSISSNSLGFEYYTSARDAQQAKRECENEDVSCAIEVIDVTPTRVGILEALRRNGSHPDNG